MGLSNGKQEENKKEFINLRLIAETGPTSVKPKFAVIGEGFEPTGAEYTEVRGKLLKVKPTFTPAKGKRGDIFGFKAFIEDTETGSVIYVIESTITNASKGLLNSLLKNGGKELKISAWLKANGYPDCSVKEKGREGKGEFVDQAVDFGIASRETLFPLIEKYFPTKERETGAELSISDIPF